MKLNRDKYIYLALLVILVLLAGIIVNALNSKNKVLPIRDYAEIVASGELRIATDYNSIGYYVMGDTIMGFQYEMIRALEKEWNMKIVVFLENRLDDNLTGLYNQDYDVVARNIPVNSALKDSFAFTDAIIINKQVLIQRKMGFNDGVPPIRQHLKLANKTIYVSKNSPAILRLQHLSSEIGDTIFIVEDNLYEAEQLAMMVASGDIDFTVCDDKVAKRLAKNFPEIDCDTDVSFTQLQSWAVRKDSPVLLDSLNHWLSRFKKTAQYDEIYKKYY